MKKTFRVFGMLLCAIFMAVGFTSCSDDDDEPEDSIVGTWLLTERDENHLLNVQFSFNANGTFVEKEWYSGEENMTDTYPGKWSVAGDKLTLVWDEDDYDNSDTFRFAIKGDKLTFYDFDGKGSSLVLSKK